MKLTPAVIEMVVADMAVSLAFDTRDTILSFHESWTPPSGGHRMAIAFACESPAEVDAAYAELVDAGAEGLKDAWDGNPVDLFAPLG